MSLTIIVASVLAMQDPQIKDVTLDAFKSVTFEASVGNAKQTELRKINNDFAQSFRFKKTDVWMKEPFKIRMETKVDDSDILMVVNGSKRMFSIPKARIKQTRELAGEPGQRQTALDFGLLPPSLFEDFFVAKYVRTDRRTNEYVFDITHKPSDDYDARHRVWVNPKTRVVSKRQWYAHSDGHLLATFEYSGHIQQNGVWFPTMLSVKNSENKLAGTTSYKKVVINPTISNDLFKL